MVNGAHCREPHTYAIPQSASLLRLPGRAPIDSISHHSNPGWWIGRHLDDVQQAQQPQAPQRPQHNEPDVAGAVARRRRHQRQLHANNTLINNLLMLYVSCCQSSVNCCNRFVLCG
jgi:hypothetical protein